MILARLFLEDEVYRRDAVRPETRNLKPVSVCQLPPACFLDTPTLVLDTLTHGLDTR